MKALKFLAAMAATIVFLSGCASHARPSPQLYSHVNALADELALDHYGSIVYSQRTGTGNYGEPEPQVQIAIAAHKAPPEVAQKLRGLGFESIDDGSYWSGKYEGSVMRVKIIGVAAGEELAQSGSAKFIHVNQDTQSFTILDFSSRE